MNAVVNVRVWWHFFGGVKQTVPNIRIFVAHFRDCHNFRGSKKAMDSNGLNQAGFTEAFQVAMRHAMRQERNRKNPKSQPCRTPCNCRNWAIAGRRRSWAWLNFCDAMRQAIWRTILTFSTAKLYKGSRVAYKFVQVVSNRANIMVT